MTSAGSRDFDLTDLCSNMLQDLGNLGSQRTRKTPWRGHAQPCVHPVGNLTCSVMRDSQACTLEYSHVAEDGPHTILGLVIPGQVAALLGVIREPRGQPGRSIQTHIKGVCKLACYIPGCDGQLFMRHVLIDGQVRKESVLQAALRFSNHKFSQSGQSAQGSPCTKPAAEAWVNM